MIFDITVRGQQRRVEVDRRGGDLLVRLEGAAEVVRLEPAAGSEWWRLEVGGRAIPVRLHARDGELLVTLGAVRVMVGVRRSLPIRSRRLPAAEGDGRVEVRAPMPGLVTATPLAHGEAVERGGTVAIVEAMKMQMEVPTPAAGRIEEVRVQPGQEVAGGQVLVVVRASSAEDPGKANPEGSEKAHS